MRKSPITRIRERITPSLDRSTPSGTLTTDELAIVYALLQVVSADEAAPRDSCLDKVNRRTQNEPGFFHAYRDGVALLRSRAPRFAELSIERRDRILHRLLRSYPHKILEPQWRRKYRLTGAVRDRILTRRRVQCFRDFVVRDLLFQYYTSARGWSVVGYEEFAGYVRTLDEPCEVTRIELDGDDLVLMLSDATVEVLGEDALRMTGDDHFSVITKWGRQTASVSRQAHNLLGQHLEEDGDDLIVRVGQKTYRVMGGHA